MDVTLQRLKERKLAVKPVDVSEWFPPDGLMYVKEISSADSLRAARKTESVDNDDDWFARCLCDKDGNGLIAEGGEIDHENIPAGLFMAIVAAALELNGFSVEDAEGNLPSLDAVSPSV